MPRRVALFGGSFNPPGLHHRQIAETLAREFDEVRVVPCGPRPDKPGLAVVPSMSRAALCDLTFGGMDRVVVDLFDLEKDEFTRSYALEEHYAFLGEVWHVVGADWLRGGGVGKSAIHTGWVRGPDLWKSSRFAVLLRPGHDLDKKDLPPNSKVVSVDLPQSSSKIRDELLGGRPATELLTPAAARYIQRYGLYRGNNPATWSYGSLSDLCATCQVDPKNAKAQDWAKKLEEYCDGGNPDYIITMGGDGTMLRAIREHWRRRLPFFGINAGHMGFLMNAPEEVLDVPFPPSQVIFRQLPMLYIELETEDGTKHTEYAFNDAWVERSTSQSAWLSVKVNGEERLKKLVADGALVSTAAGSTAYARSMGASPLLADTPAWLLVGSNVMEPPHWKSALLSTDNSVELVNLQPEPRPINAFVDGLPKGPVKAMRARLSRAATVELAFLASHDMAEKIAAIQFQKI